jgi:SPP1 family predicted phage head-tail adaptor
MRAGSLDRVLEIQRPTTTLDLYGTPTQGWAKVATMRAAMLQYSTDDREGQRGSATDATVTFRTRWLDGVTLENSVLYDGERFKITGIKEIGRRVGLDIMCERVGP